jgi:hypothetical protein
MNGPLRPIKPGEEFYLHHEKTHCVGVVTTGDEPVHVFWEWAKHRKRRMYRAVPEWQLEVQWEFMKKNG